MNNIRVHIHRRDEIPLNTNSTSIIPLLTLFFGISNILNTLNMTEEEDYLEDILIESAQSNENIEPKSIDDIIFKECKFEEIKNKCKDTECSICKNDFEESSIVSKLDCGHIFDIDCIKKWAQLNRTCPICRKDIK